jgi:hypothetical protein
VLTNELASAQAKLTIVTLGPRAFGW